jgi:hypothetical protein
MSFIIVDGFGGTQSGLITDGYFVIEMSNEIKIAAATGKTLYGVVLDPNALGWNANTSAFETLNAADWPSYKIALPEISGCGIYVGTFPTGISASGLYTVILYVQGGAVPASTDVSFWMAQMPWNQTSEASPLNAIVAGYNTGEDPASLLKNDPRFKRLLSYVDCNSVYDKNSGILTIYDTDGVTILMRVTLNFWQGTNVIKSKAVSYS